MILQVRFTFWWSLKFKKLNSFIILWNKVGWRNFNFVTWKIEKLRKLATGHPRNYLVTIGNLGYLKLVKSDMYPKFLKINLVVVVRHSALACLLEAKEGRQCRSGDSCESRENANEEGALPSEIAAESASSGHTIRAEEKNLQMWSSGLLFTGLIW